MVRSILTARVADGVLAACQTNTKDFPTGLATAHSPEVITFRLDKAFPVLHEVLSG